MGAATYTDKALSLMLLYLSLALTSTKTGNFFSSSSARANDCKRERRCEHVTNTQKHEKLITNYRQIFKATGVNEDIKKKL
jgi:hypothetical protein